MVADRARREQLPSHSWVLLFSGLCTRARRGRQDPKCPHHGDQHAQDAFLEVLVSCLAYPEPPPPGSLPIQQRPPPTLIHVLRSEPRGPLQASANLSASPASEMGGAIPDRHGAVAQTQCHTKDLNTSKALVLLLRSFAPKWLGQPRLEPAPEPRHSRPACPWGSAGQGPLELAEPAGPWGGEQCVCGK